MRTAGCRAAGAWSHWAVGGPGIASPSMSTITTASDPERRSHGPRVAARAALDVMLTDAAFEEGGARRFIKPIAAAKVAAGLARHPDRLMRRAGGLGRELATTAA